MRLDVIEQCSGVGRIYDENGQHIGESRYDLQVLQEVHDSPTGDVPGLKRIEGTVEVIADIGRALTIHLEDGRRLDFFIADVSGRIAHRGGKGLVGT